MSSNLERCSNFIPPSPPRDVELKAELYSPCWICPLVGMGPAAALQLLFWNGGQEAHPAEVSVHSSTGTPVSMRWEHGIAGESTTLPLPAGRATMLSATPANSDEAKIGWARIWTPAPFFGGYAIVDFGAHYGNRCMVVEFVTDSKSSVTLPLLSTDTIASRYLLTNTYPTPAGKTRRFEILHYLAKGGTRTVEVVELGGYGTYVFRAPELTDPTELGILEFRAVDGKAGFFAAGTYFAGNDLGLLRSFS